MPGDILNRRPVVAGQFYPGDAATLTLQIQKLLGPLPPSATPPALLAMVPHAGYVYSGAVCGKTLAMARPASTVVLLGPNHTGRGARLAVWPDGHWLFPGGQFSVDADLTAALMEAEPHFVPDRDAHLGEHSLEVILPFLHQLDPTTRIVPICVSEFTPSILAQTGKALGRLLKGLGTPASLVVSSDMSHYVSHDTAKAQDGLALERIMALNPEGLYATVREHRISMCGVLPMTLGLHAALELGATSAELAAYATSGEVSGDMHQVVGYAGVVVR